MRAPRAEHDGFAGCLRCAPHDIAHGPRAAMFDLESRTPVECGGHAGDAGPVLDDARTGVYGKCRAKAALDRVFEWRRGFPTEIEQRRQRFVKARHIIAAVTPA